VLESIFLSNISGNQINVKTHVMSDIASVLILGSGPAGLTAAVYAARANLAPVIIDGDVPGGQLMLTTEVENYPGFPDGILGPELMEKFRKQAQRFGAQFINGVVTGVDFSGSPLIVSVGNETVQGRSVIIATGASTRWLGLKSETRLRGHGVSSCATCDGAFFREKKLIVVGGGDSAMEEALFLTKFATSVTVVHRRDALRASKIMQERAMHHPKIQFIWNTAVEEIFGETHVEGVRLKNVQTEEVTTMPIDGVFVAIGHVPNTAMFQGVLDLDPKGYIVTPDLKTTATKIPGVFVAGDVIDFRYRQAVTAAGSGCRAAIDAERWLEEIHSFKS
jgi:thioredoxin reductase (NADPH)